MPILTILVVDDDDSFGMIQKRLLKDCNVSTVSTVREAMEFIDKNRVDLVITDIVMPKESGLDLIEKLEQKHPNIPIIAKTCLWNDEYTARMIKKRVNVIGIVTRPEDDVKIPIIIQEYFSGLQQVV